MKRTGRLYLLGNAILKTVSSQMRAFISRRINKPLVLAIVTLTLSSAFLNAREADREGKSFSGSRDLVVNEPSSIVHSADPVFDRDAPAASFIARGKSLLQSDRSRGADANDR